MGVDHNGKDDAEWRQHLTEAMQSFVGGTGEFDPAKIDAEAWKRLTDAMYYLVGDFEDPKTYDAMRDKLAQIDADHGTGGNVIFYLAVADRFFGRVVDELGKAKLVEQGEGKPWRRVVIEKAVRPRPADLERPQQANPAVVAGGPDLPDRSLPREGDGPEHHDPSASPTACSSRCGTGTISITCRSRWPRRSASRDAARSTKRPAHCATWCRTTSSSS